MNRCIIKCNYHKGYVLDRNLSNRALRLLFSPLVKFCLRHALRIQDAIDCLKGLFVELAEEQLKERQEEVTISRLSAMTGMHRRDVMVYQTTSQPESNQADLCTRILGLWQTDKTFLTPKKEPRVLSVECKNAEFAKLVRKVSRDISPATMLFELERVGAVEREAQGVRLVKRSYVPRGDTLKGLGILADDCNDLICAVEDNILGNSPVPNLHARTFYDRIRADSLLDLKRWLVQEGHKFHALMRDRLALIDQDVNPDPCYKGPFAQVTVQSFSQIRGKSEIG